MLRRRLSSLGKMALAVAAPLARANPGIASVFCSQHGELERTVQLLTEVAGQQPLSPTQFSLSVHNAIGGLLSMATKDPSPMTALACEDGEVSAALLEAALIAREQDNRQALCVIYDEPLPSPYPRDDMPPARPYALALVIYVGDNPAPGACPLELQVLSPDTAQGALLAKGGDEPEALQLVRLLLLQKQQQLTLASARHTWRWCKLQVTEP
jgi:hypothetical protein